MHTRYMQEILDEKNKENNEEGKVKDEENQAKVVAAVASKPMFYELPWEANLGANNGDAVSQIVKDCLALANDTSALLASKEEQEYVFNFDMDSYVILAQIMVKFDKNLQKTR